MFRVFLPFQLLGSPKLAPFADPIDVGCESAEPGLAGIFVNSGGLEPLGEKHVINGDGAQLRSRIYVAQRETAVTGQ